MIIGFELESHEKRITPMNTANALIESEQFTREQLKELIAYLSVYTRYNEDHDNITFNKNPFGRR